MKRKVTDRDYDAMATAIIEFDAAIHAERQQIDKVVGMSLQVRDGAHAVGDIDSGLSAVLAGAAIISDKVDTKLDPLARKFDRTVANFVGESRRQDESHLDFLERISALLRVAVGNDEFIQAIRRTQVKNGITWVRT